MPCCDAPPPKGKQEHCPVRGCHQTFTGATAGDMHRTGKHHVSLGPDRRRCLTEAEMLAKGMARNGRGIWMSSARDEEAA